MDTDRGAKLADRVQDLINKSSLHKMSQNKRNLENGDAEAKKKAKEEISNAQKPANPLSPNQVQNLFYLCFVRN